MLMKREPRPGLPSAAAIFATGSIAALALALTFALEKGWLTVALALMVPGVAWIAEQRPLPWLRAICGVLVVLVMLRIGYEPRIMADIGTTPIFNWILYGYGVPAAAFWLAGWLLRRRADDTPARMVDAAAILFTVLTAFLEIRHYIYSGDIYLSTSAGPERSRAAGVRRACDGDRAGAAARAHQLGRARGRGADRRGAEPLARSCSGSCCSRTRG